MNGQIYVSFCEPERFSISLSEKLFRKQDTQRAWLGHVNYSGLPVAQVIWLLIMSDFRRMGNQLISEFMLARQTGSPAVRNL